MPPACSAKGCPTARATWTSTASTARLARLARYLITETLEPDHDDAVFMREAQERLAAARTASTE